MKRMMSYLNNKALYIFVILNELKLIDYALNSQHKSISVNFGLLVLSTE